MRHRLLVNSAPLEVLILLAGSYLLGTAAWRLTRYAAFQNGLEWLLEMAPTRSADPVRLAIPRLGMSVAVSGEDDEASLALGAGHIPGTAQLGAFGNAAFAGHRDTAFRALGGIRIGDEIRGENGQTFRYVVTRIIVVNPDDISVLRDTGEPQLTLITCYPFGYFGNAPQRYVVQAKMLR